MYRIFNAAAPTTAALVKVTTGVTIKTMLQLATSATRQFRLAAWGFTTDAAPAAAGVGVVELFACTGAATVTAHAASGVPNMDPNGPASALTLGTAATGFTASAEGTPASVRMLDAEEVAGVSNGSTTTFRYQFMPDERPIIAVSTFVRVRVTFSAATNMLVWVAGDDI